MTVENIIVVAIIAAALVAVVSLVVWRNARLVLAELALKQEAVRNGLAAPEIEHLLKLPSVGSHTDAELVGTIARVLADIGVSGIELEQAMALVQGADSPTKQSVAQAFDRMPRLFVKSPDLEARQKEQFLAVLRGCCGAVRLKVNAEGDIPTVPAKPGAAADVGRDTAFSELGVAQRG